MARIDYSKVARFYCAIEYCVFGRKLEVVRAWCLKSVHLEPGAKVLLVGGGDGRFLSDLLAAFEGVDVDYVEPSKSMLELARKQVECDAQVTWNQCCIEDWHGGTYDLVVAHFVLDTFEPQARAGFVNSLIGKVRLGGELVLSDFSMPMDSWSRMHMWLMQWFFYIVVAQPRWELRKDEAPFFEQGAELSCEGSWNKGWIYSQIWKI